MMELKNVKGVIYISRLENMSLNRIEEVIL